MSSASPEHTRRHTMEYAISLGSNIGDRLAHFRQARAAIAAMEQVTLLAASPVYETEPVDVAPPYDDLAFLNAALLITSTLPPATIAQRLHAIEVELGRVRTADRNTPRTIDIDLIYADDTVIATPELKLPHARWNERRFVVQPLADLRPDRILPGETRTVGAILATLPRRPGVTLFTRDW